MTNSQPCDTVNGVCSFQRPTLDEVLRVNLDSEQELRVRDLLLNGADDLEEDPRPVLERAAVSVRPLVDGRRDELAQQVTVL